MALPEASAATGNLSLTGGADGSSKADGTSYGNVKDGSTSTYWSPSSPTGYVSVKWSSATTVSSAVIIQASGGGSIGAWRLTNGVQGPVLASGSGSPGTINFSSTSLTKLTFEITSASSAPRIAEFETYAAGTTTPTSAAPTTRAPATSAAPTTQAPVTSAPATTSSAKPTVAADGTGTYKTVQAAIDAVPASNTTRRVITIKAGTYREIVTVPSTKPYITLQGLGSSPSQVNIINNHGANNYGTFNSATVFVNGHDFTATNLQFSNDFDETNAGSGTQAVAVNDNADRTTFNNVRFIADQDTLLVNASARSYFVNSYIEGTVDFIFGDGIAVFNACSIYEKRSTGGPLTAARTPSSHTYGFLIYKSTITGAVAGKTQLGRPWGQDAQVLFRESNLSNTIATAQPWIDMSSNTWQNARFYEYKNTGAGATTNSNRRQMSDSMATSYTPQKYLAGSDGWNPL